MMIIKSFGVLSVGKALGCLYALMGLLLGGLFTLIALMGAGAGANRGQGGDGAAMLVGAGAIIFFPIIYGIMGFIGGIIAAAIYNVVASIAGGIELELERGPDYRQVQNPYQQ